MIDHESLPMWLTTIKAGKLNDVVREKLERHLCEAKNVLAAWFHGTCRDSPALATELADVRERLEELERDQSRIRMMAAIVRAEADLAEDRASCGLSATGSEDTEYMTAKEFFELSLSVTRIRGSLSPGERPQGPTGPRSVRPDGSKIVQTLTGAITSADRT